MHNENIKEKTDTIRAHELTSVAASAAPQSLPKFCSLSSFAATAVALLVAVVSIHNDERHQQMR